MQFQFYSKEMGHEEMMWGNVSFCPFTSNRSAVGLGISCVSRVGLRSLGFTTDSGYVLTSEGFAQMRTDLPSQHNVSSKIQFLDRNRALSYLVPKLKLKASFQAALLGPVTPDSAQGKIRFDGSTGCTWYNTRSCKFHQGLSLEGKWPGRMNSTIGCSIDSFWQTVCKEAATPSPRFVTPNSYGHKWKRLAHSFK